MKLSKMYRQRRITHTLKPTAMTPGKINRHKITPVNFQTLAQILRFSLGALVFALCLSVYLRVTVFPQIRKRYLFALCWNVGYLFFSFRLYLFSIFVLGQRKDRGWVVYTWIVFTIHVSSGKMCEKKNPKMKFFLRLFTFAEDSNKIYSNVVFCLECLNV